MRKLLLLLPLFLFAACGNSQSPDSDIDVDLIENPNSANGYDSKAAMPAISFDCEQHDFGRLTEGESVSYSFHFRNGGNADLVISSCSPSCGCTVADYPRGRIAPGEDGNIFVTFNSKGKTGMQFNEVDVFSNSQPSHTKLKIIAQVGH